MPEPRAQDTGDQDIKRVEKLLDFVSENPERYSSAGNFRIEYAMDRMVRIFCNPSTALILYLIYSAHFSSRWELRSKLATGQSYQVDRDVAQLEMYELLEPLTEECEDFAIVSDFWKLCFPTSPRTPVFYRITERARDIVGSYIEPIRHRYSWGALDRKISRRRRSYEQYREKVIRAQQQHEQAEKRSLGRCLRCNKLIPDDSVPGTHHHTFRRGYVCDRCSRVATKEEMISWTRA